MNFSYSDLASIESVLADAILFVGDPSMRMLTKGFYVRQAKRGLDELGFETFFSEQYQDIEMPSNLRLEMPSGAWNLRDVFVFNTYIPGDDTNQCCEIMTPQRVFHKSNFLSRGAGRGYTARNKTGQDDNFITPFSSDTTQLFYNVQNGLIMLSDACSAYQYIRIVYNGTPSSIDKTNMIPPFAKNAITAYVVERALYALKLRDPRYRVAWADSKVDLYGQPSRFTSSKWDEAKYRLKSMDKKHRDDLAEYLSRGAW